MARIIGKYRNFLSSENFVVEKKFYYFSVCVHSQFSPAMQKLLKNPDSFLENSAGPFFKNDEGDTTTIGVVSIDGKELVVKRYNIKNWLHFIKKCWRKSRAFCSFQNSFYLKQNDIDTVEPVAIVEQRFGFLRGKSYFISEYVKAIRGCDYFDKNAMFNSNWQLIAGIITAMMQKLYNAHIRHHDFQYGNMLILNDKVLLLDLDHMKIYKKNSWFFRRAFYKDMAHFLFFLESNLTAKEIFKNMMLNNCDFLSHTKFQV